MAPIQFRAIFETPLNGVARPTPDEARIATPQLVPISLLSEKETFQTWDAQHNLDMRCDMCLPVAVVT